MYFAKKNDPNINVEKEISEWHKTRALHKSAFEILSAFIEKEIIENEEIFAFTDIYLQYKAILHELCDSEDCSFDNYSSQRLESELRKYFTISLL